MFVLCFFIYFYCYTVVSVSGVVLFYVFVFFFKQKTAYEMRISDWSSDVCSSDLLGFRRSSLYRCFEAVIGLHANRRFPSLSHVETTIEAAPTRKLKANPSWYKQFTEH